MTHWQDCVAFIPPHPYYIGNPDDFEIMADFNEMWFGRLQLLFTCVVCGTNDLVDDPAESVTLNLALISTFEILPNAPVGMTRKMSGIGDILYDPKKTPILYIVPIDNILCRVPLMPCFLCGGQENTIPYDLRRLNKPDMGLMADSAPGKGDGSRVYEINVVVAIRLRHA